MGINIEILKDAEHLRFAFMKNFLLSWDEFQVVHKDFIVSLSEKYNETVDINFYNQSLMWDRMRPEYQTVSFDKALYLLKSIDRDILFMSEYESNAYSCDLNYNGEVIKNFIARTNAKELAELVEHEWFEAVRLAQQNMYNPFPVLPEDIYVFDSSMDWFVVFTHETTDWESELDDPMKAAESRICIVYGFDEEQ